MMHCSKPALATRPRSHLTQWRMVNPAHESAKCRVPFWINSCRQTRTRSEPSGVSITYTTYWHKRENKGPHEAAIRDVGLQYGNVGEKLARPTLSRRRWRRVLRRQKQTASKETIWDPALVGPRHRRCVPGRLRERSTSSTHTTNYSWGGMGVLEQAGRHDISTFSIHELLGGHNGVTTASWKDVCRNISPHVL